MPQQTFFTIRDVLRHGVSEFMRAKLFFGHGTTNAYDEAVYLILHTLHLPLDSLEPFLDARLLPEEINAVLSIIQKRVLERLPAAYLTQEAWLCGYRFYVDPRVIVPRSLIAELLQEQLTPWLSDPSGIAHVLELCTGSACLAILAKQFFPNAVIDAVDISEEALQVARINLKEYELEQDITLHLGDLYSPLKKRQGEAQQSYDLIFSNPPYVNARSMQKLPREYQHEPDIALAGGLDGMDIVRRIVEEAKHWLSPSGVLVVEVGHEKEHVESAFPALPFVWLTTPSGHENQVFLLHYQDLP